MVATGAYDETLRVARERVSGALEALTILPESPYRGALEAWPGCSWSG